MHARLFYALTALVVTGVLAPASYAAYPDKPIRIIIPFAAGASADAYARVAATKLTERMGQPVLVEARPGANGIIATELVAKAAPDGYTLLLVNSSHSINQAVYRKLPYDADRDFVAIGLVAVPVSLMLVAHPSVPANNGKELIELARQKPDQIAFGSAGIGNVLHLAGALFNVTADVRLLHVPYKGAAPALNDLLAGQVQLMWNASGLVLPHVRAGKLKPIAAAGLKRSAEFPDVPTLAESALPGYVVSSWFGILAPAATPTDIVRRLRSEMHQGLIQPDARDRLAQVGADGPHLTPEEFAAFVKTDAEDTAKLVKRIGLALEAPPLR
jgi:tripartite-type tricarboxylate transporter receptor subunit TctC